jgi:hypothetical protein
MSTPVPGDQPHHERIEDETFRRAVDLLDAGNVEQLREHLQAHPDLVDQHVSFEGNYFNHPTLLEFVAENPIRRGKLPANILEIAQVILEAGAKTNKDALKEALGLVVSGRIARECGAQTPLINLLCHYGADPNSAVHTASAHGEFEAVVALLARGARLDLPVAAALGQAEEARRLLPVANALDRHRALALAAQFGRVEIVRLLLDAGGDPSRYNPPGFHGHSTPLHQAALAGHEEVVRLLVEHGARLDLKDTIWNGTPAGWARYEGRTAIADYLAQHEAY